MCPVHVTSVAMFAASAISILINKIGMTLHKEGNKNG